MDSLDCNRFSSVVVLLLLIFVLTRSKIIDISVYRSLVTCGSERERFLSIAFWLCLLLLDDLWYCGRYFFVLWVYRGPWSIEQLFTMNTRLQYYKNKEIGYLIRPFFFLNTNWYENRKLDYFFFSFSSYETACT